MAMVPPVDPEVELVHRRRRFNSSILKALDIEIPDEMRDADIAALQLFSMVDVRGIRHVFEHAVKMRRKELSTTTPDQETASKLACKIIQSMFSCVVDPSFEFDIKRSPDDGTTVVTFKVIFSISTAAQYTAHVITLVCTTANVSGKRIDSAHGSESVTKQLDYVGIGAVNALCVDILKMLKIDSDFVDWVSKKIEWKHV